VPTVAIGDGFTLPPATLDRFTILHAESTAPKFAEAETLSVVNGVLVSLDRRKLRALPELFAADRSCASSFSELDPYRKDRQEPLAAPSVPDWDRSVPMSRNELFGYFSMNTATRSTILLALSQVVRTGLRVRVYIPQPDVKTTNWLATNGVLVESTPSPFDQIQRRARLLISIGSSGFVSCALASGIPQLVVPSGIAKEATGAAVERLGVGRSISLNPASPIEPVLLAQVIAEAYANAQFTDKAKSLAPDFARRLKPSPAEVVADLMSEIV
jgi:UDP:flavonoid glycosyltransferase YjiC (YdhE family)